MRDSVSLVSISKLSNVSAVSQRLGSSVEGLRVEDRTHNNQPEVPLTW